jgi:type II secretory pathway predicted ATPase ExeA
MKSETDLQRLAHQWGARHVPFAPLQDADWLDTPATQKALAYLMQTAALRSAMLLSGPNGAGKSALAGRWLRSLDERLFAPLCLTQATLSGSGILASLAAKLGKAFSFRRERNLQLIEEALQDLDRRILVVVLDEAQNYTHSALEEVRLLLGLNLPQAPAFALVLIGDEYLLSSLKLRNHRALYSRLACQVSLPVWERRPMRAIPLRRPASRRPEPSSAGRGRRGTVEQRQRRPAPQLEPAGPRRLDRRRQPGRAEDQRRPRAKRVGNRALRAGAFGCAHAGQPCVLNPPCPCPWMPGKSSRRTSCTVN